MKISIAIKTALLLTIFFVLDGLYDVIFITGTVFLLILGLVYFTINSRQLEKLNWNNKSDEYKEPNNLFYKGLKMLLIARITITLFRLINITLITIIENKSDYIRGLIFNLIILLISFIAYFSIQKIYKMNESKFSDSIISGILYLVTFYVVSFKITHWFILKLANSSDAQSMLIYYSVFVVFTILFNNKISRLLIKYKNDFCYLESVILIIGILMIIFFFFNYHLFRYRLFNGDFIANIYYMSFLIIGVLMLIFNKRLAIFFKRDK